MDEAGHALVDPATPDAARPRVRVLVADDEDDIRDLVCLAVAKAGCTVVRSVADGADGAGRRARGAPRPRRPRRLHARRDRAAGVRGPARRPGHGAASASCCSPPAPPPTTSPAVSPRGRTPTCPSPSASPRWSSRSAPSPRGSRHDDGRGHREHRRPRRVQAPERLLRARASRSVPASSPGPRRSPPRASCCTRAPPRRPCWSWPPCPLLIHEGARRLGAQAATIARLETERRTLATQVRTRADELDVATRMLAARAQTMTSVIDAVTEQSIIGTDRDGVIRVWNPGAEKMLGLPRLDVVRKRSIVDFHLPEELAAVAEDVGVDRPGWAPWCTPPRSTAATSATGPTWPRTASSGRWPSRSPRAPTTAASTPAGTSSART